MILNGSSCDQDHMEYTRHLGRRDHHGLLSDAQLSRRIIDGPRAVRVPMSGLGSQA